VRIGNLFGRPLYNRRGKTRGKMPRGRPETI
jgi:hypothetical protein